MAVSAPPKKKPATVPVDQGESTRKVSEKKIDEIINRGSSTVNKPEQPKPDQIKNFNVKILSSSLAEIDQLRAKRPRKPTSPKLGISSHDWILEAIEEKIQREKKKYKIG